MLVFRRFYVVLRKLEALKKAGTKPTFCCFNSRKIACFSQILRGFPQTRSIEKKPAQSRLFAVSIHGKKRVFRRFCAVFRKLKSSKKSSAKPTFVVLIRKKTCFLPISRCFPRTRSIEKSRRKADFCCFNSRKNACFSPILRGFPQTQIIEKKPAQSRILLFQFVEKCLFFANFARFSANSNHRKKAGAEPNFAVSIRGKSVISADFARFSENSKY